MFTIVLWRTSDQAPMLPFARIEGERAAIVYAFTKPEKGGRPKAGNSPENGVVSDGAKTVSIVAFSRLKINGLTKEDTVSFYRNAYQQAVDAGKAKAVKPGDTFALVPRYSLGRDGRSEPVGHQEPCITPAKEPSFGERCGRGPF